MNTKENEIIKYFVKTPWKKYTFTEIKTISKKKSKSYVDFVLKKFIKEDILTKETISRIPIYSLNISSTKARVYAGFILEKLSWDKKNIPYKDIEKLIKKILIKNYTLIITGSYAKNTQTSKSDLDVVILVEDSCEVKKIYSELAFICEMNIPKIHLYIFKNSEFLEMLLNNQANYGKAIVQNNLILLGGQTYLQLIIEAMHHGFRDNNIY